VLASFVDEHSIPYVEPEPVLRLLALLRSVFGTGVCRVGVCGCGLVPVRCATPQTGPLAPLSHTDTQLTLLARHWQCESRLGVGRPWDAIARVGVLCYTAMCEMLAGPGGLGRRHAALDALEARPAYRVP
jgi:hypothetical protein